MTATPTPTNPLVVYGHPACPQLPPVLGLLKSANVDYTYVNIHQDDVARARVRTINEGYESVPTLVFPDGSTLTEPSAGQLTRKLHTYGYRVPLLGRLLGNSFQLLMLAIIVFAVLRFLGVI